jgi:hypothetical protein
MGMGYWCNQIRSGAYYNCNRTARERERWVGEDGKRRRSHERRAVAGKQSKVGGSGSEYCSVP